MPPHKKKATPKDDFFEHGRQLLQDAENSTNPKFAKLRAKAAKRYFDAHVKGGARISTGLALGVGLPVLLVMAVPCVYAGITFSASIFWFVLIACVTFALIILLLLLALTGLMGDTVVAKVMVGIFDELMATFRKTNSDDS
jgi:hypothetical protein